MILYISFDLYSWWYILIKHAKCLFNGCSTNYIWHGLTSNMIGHLQSSHYTTKVSLNNQSAEEILTNAQIINLPKPHNQTQ